MYSFLRNVNYFLSCNVMVLFVLISVTSSQDEVVTESSQATTVICQLCSCAEGTVDCAGRGLQTWFKQGDWLGVAELKPTVANLTGNTFNTISRFPELPIQYLNLSNCGIASISSAAFMNLVDLVSLDLSSNAISTSVLQNRVMMGKVVTGGYSPPQPFEKIRYLSLAHNDIHSLTHNTFAFMPGLTTLDLSGNPMAYIDQLSMAAITDLVNLADLRLASCQLETLPEGIFRRSRRLERLDLSDNRFTTIPTSLSEATNLVYLNLDKNSFENFSEKTSIAGLSKIQELHLSRLSKLHSIGPGVLGGLESLVVLYMNYNPRLTTLDKDFLLWQNENDVDRWPMLKELYLNGNNLSTINAHFLDRWDQLTSMDFSNNPYKCDCGSQWMVEVLVPQIMSTGSNDTTNHMICKSPNDLHGLSFAQLQATSKTLVCNENENQSLMMEPDTIIMLGVAIGVFVTFPVVLILVLLWKRGYFSRCRSGSDKDDDEEIEAF